VNENTSFNLRRGLIFGTYALGVLLVFLGLQFETASRAFAKAASNNPCPEAYTSGVGIPPNYGAAFDVFATSGELMLHTTCDSSGNVAFSIGVTDTTNTEYIYKNGYQWNGASWVPITFTGTPAPNAPDWLVTNASLNIASANLRPAGTPNYVVGYSCMLIGGAWKCGCRDNFCAANLWQLQSFTYPAAPPAAVGGGGSASSGAMSDGQQINFPLSMSLSDTKVTPDDVTGFLGTANNQSAVDLIHKLRTSGSTWASTATVGSLGLKYQVGIQAGVNSIEARYNGTTVSSRTTGEYIVSFQGTDVTNNTPQAASAFFTEVMRKDFTVNGNGVTTDIGQTSSSGSSSGGGSSGTTGGTTSGGSTASTGGAPAGFPHLLYSATPSSSDASYGDFLVRTGLRQFWGETAGAASYGLATIGGYAAIQVTATKGTHGANAGFIFKGMPTSGVAGGPHHAFVRAKVWWPKGYDFNPYLNGSRSGAGGLKNFGPWGGGTPAVADNANNDGFALKSWTGTQNWITTGMDLHSPRNTSGYAMVNFFYNPDGSTWRIDAHQGQWVQFEWQVDIEDSAGGKGRIQLWINGVKGYDRSDITFFAPSAWSSSAGVKGMYLSNWWGGAGVAPATTPIYYKDIELWGK
jgi:hypothetical protein